LSAASDLGRQAGSPRCLRGFQRLLETAEGRLLASVVLIATTLNAPTQLSGDTWYNLVLAREQLHSGLVTHNDLTVQGFGQACVDVQWLAHLCLGGLERALGLPGLVWVASALSALALLGAAAFALSGGASPGRVLFGGVLALGGLLPQTLRAQSLALPFLAIFPCVLAADARAPRRSTWWLVPCAVLWANLHGSVLLAPALMALVALCRVLETLRVGQRGQALRMLGRDVLLGLCLLASLWASPYARHILEYYRSTFGNADFRVYLREWAPLVPWQEPTTSLLLAAVFVIAALGARRLSSFPLLASVSLACFTLRSARHATPLALSAAAFLPAAADASLGRRLRFEADRSLERISRWLLGIATLVFSVGIPWLTAHTLRSELPVEFTDAVALAARGAKRILSDEHQADRLLWFHPELTGRLSHDARIEVIPPAFLAELTQAYGFPTRPRERLWLHGYDLVIVDRQEHQPLWAALSADAGWRLEANDHYAAAFSRLGPATDPAASAPHSAPPRQTSPP
jgi:hypothetical protein